MEIYDANGTRVVTYTYDAWGNVTVNSDTSGYDIGNINPILFVSRFARNTVTTLETVRLLKEYDVDVWFERENIHSMSGEGEFMLTILASFAQEESLSASENQKWKIRKNFEDGRPTYTRLLGYYLDGDTFKIIPEEAEIVRLIYSSYLSGMGLLAICKLLTEKDYPTICGGQWRETTIRRILTNEKYVGDMLLQKTFREDHISKKIRRNNGELPKYYIEDSHEAIIDRDTFNRVQEEIKCRAIKTAGRKQPITESVFTKKIVCEQCGSHYRRKVLTGGKVVWICGTFNPLVNHTANRNKFRRKYLKNWSAARSSAKFASRVQIP